MALRRGNDTGPSGRAGRFRNRNPVAMTLGRRHYLLTAQILISGVLLAWLISFAKPSELIAAARNVSPVALLVTAALLMFANALAALRQSIILRALGIDVSFLRMVALNWMGLFANNFLPSSVGGDAAIAAILQSKYRRFGTIVSALLINRIFGLIGLMVLLLILFILVDLGALQELVNHVIQWSIGLLLLLGLAGTMLIVLLRGDNRFARLVASGFARLQAMSVTAVNLGWTSLGIFAFSVAIMLLLGATTALLGCWLYSAADFWTTTTIVLMLQLVLLLPITFNGIGMTESVAAYCLTEIGWPLHEAVLYSLLLRGLTIAISLPGVAAFFFVPKTDRIARETQVVADIDAEKP